MCKRISLISYLVKGIHKMADFKQLPAKVTKVTDRLNQEKKDRKKIQNSLNASGKSMLTKIKTLRYSLNELLDDLEKRTVEQLYSVLADLNGSLQKDIDHCDLLHDKHKALLDTVQAQGKESSISFKKCEDTIEEANRLLYGIATKHEATITFQPDTRAQQLLSDLKALGNIQVYADPQYEKSPGQIHQSSNKSKVFKVEEKKTYAVHIKKDKDDCGITGITEQPGEEIVLVDLYNSRVKVLDSKYKVISHCDLPENPRDICHISDHQVSVAVNKRTVRYEVHFLTVSADTIKMTRRFSADHDCRSIKHHEGQLYVGSFTALYLYTTDGSLVNKIYEDSSEICTVNHVALSTDGSKLYVPASSKNKIVTIDRSGNILATLHDPDFHWTYGVHVSEAGHVFVCFPYSGADWQ